MSEQPDLTQHIKGHEDPFLHGEGETWGEVFKGEDPSFSASFYREQADEVRARRDECAECDTEGHESARRADQSLRGISGRRA